jgi:hypothetical protein
MSLPIATPGQLSVSIGGTSYPQAILLGVHEGLLPQVDQAGILLNIGRRLASGSLAAHEPAISPRDAVELEADSWSWSGEVVRVTERGSGDGRVLEIRAQGLAARLDRSYLTGWSGGEDAPVLNAAGGNRSATASGPGGTYALAPGSGLKWTQAQGLAAIMANANGLGSLTLSGHGALAGCDVWDLRGLPALAGLFTLLGPRSRNGLRCLGSSLEVVNLRPTGGATVDLTRAQVRSYDLERDGSATVEELHLRGGETTWVSTFLHYPAGTGDLVAAGSGLAGKLLLLDPSTIGDGSASSSATFAGGLPARISGGSLLGLGPQYATPYLVFLKLGDGTWEDWTGRVSITQAGRLGLSLSGGTEWEEAFAACDRIAITAALTSGRPMRTSRNAGAGVGHARRDLGGWQVLCSSGTALGVGSGGSLISTGSSSSESSSDLEDAAEDLWPLLSADRYTLTWVEAGYDPLGLDPGDAVASVTLPKASGSGFASRSVSLGGVLVERSISASPEPLTTYRVGLPDAGLGGYSR